MTAYQQALNLLSLANDGNDLLDALEALHLEEEQAWAELNKAQIL